MNNTEKLLRAFIEASGYDVEEVETFNEAQYLVKAEDYKNNPSDYRGAFCKSPPFKAAYTEINYKVTKKVVTTNASDETLDDFMKAMPETDLSNARLTFFRRGVPECSYADYKESIPNPNPVIADSEGVFPGVWMTPPYRVVLSDRRGNDLFIKDYHEEI